MRANKKIILSISVFLVSLMLLGGADALSVSVSQSGADNDEVMKGRTFTIEASGWEDSCSQATLSFSGCSSCGLSGESTVKTISEGASSVSWTTASASQDANAQYVSVTVSSGCDSQSDDSDTFNIVLPPSLTLTVTPSSVTVDEGESYSVNINAKNLGETTARSPGIGLSGTGMSISSGCSLTEIAEGANVGDTCTISTSMSGSHSAVFTLSASNADSASDTVSVTVNDIDGDQQPDGGSPGGDDTSPGGGLPPSGDEEEETVSRRPDLVPGQGLRNNTKLQNALEKVMQKNVSGEALENLIRLSNSITAEIETTKNFRIENGQSKLSTTMKYNGRRNVNSFSVYDKVPKSFAQSATEITVSAPGAEIEIVESDPEYLLFYESLSPDDEITITYTVNEEVDSSVIDDTATSVYAESYEGLEEGQVCDAGETRCHGDVLQECSEDMTEWVDVKTCQHGCENGQCKMGPPTALDSTVIMMALAAVIIVIVVVLAILGFKKKKKKGFKFSKPTPDMKMKPDLP